MALPFLRIRSNGETRLRPRYLLDGRYRHAGIDSDHPILVSEDGIEIELAHLRQVGRRQAAPL